MTKFFLAIMTVLCAQTINAQSIFTVHVSNPSVSERHDAPVVLSLKNYPSAESALVTCSGKEIPCQLDDIDQDGINDELCFLADLKGKEKKDYRVQLSAIGEPRQYASRVYTDLILRNPKSKDKNRHDIYIADVTATKRLKDPYHNLLHMHGGVMENELIAFRFYFNEKQTIDLYGKYKPRLELEQTQFYPSKEQKAEGYGDDILWCGDAFGLGAFRGWNGNNPTMISDVNYRTQRIISYGPLRAIMEIEDRGWRIDSLHPRIDLRLRYTLYAGNRDIAVDVFTNPSVDDIDFSTGLINVKNSEEYTNHKGLRGLWGTDYPAKDTTKWQPETVGMGIYMPSKYLVKELPANKDNYTYIIRVPERHMCYHLTFGSNKEEYGYHNANDWFAFLKQWKSEIEKPIRVSIESTKGK